MTLKQRLILLYSVVVTVIFLGMAVNLIHFISSTLENKARTETTELAERIVDEIDTKQYKEMLQEGDSHPYYKVLQERLNIYRELMDLPYVYTMYKTGDKYYYAVDSINQENPYDFSAFGDEEREPDEVLETVLQSKKTHTENITSNDEYGDLITSYSPIISPDGTVLGVVGVDADASNILKEIAELKLILAATLITAFIVLLGYNLSYTVRLVKRLTQIKLDVEVMERKDLTKAVQVHKGKDEVSQLSSSVAHLQNRLRHFVLTLRNESITMNNYETTLDNQIKETTRQMEETFQHISHINDMAEEQATQVDNAVYDLRQIQHNVSDFVQTVVNLNDIAEDNRQKTELGMKRLQNTVKQADEMSQSMNESSEQLTELNEGIYKISDILTIIQTISEQTNLLSLNASIEATRAGESGKGFSVVAEEIRKLSNETKTAVSGISELLFNIEQVSKKTTNVMQQSSKDVRDVKKSVQGLLDQMGNFVEISEQLVQIVTQTRTQGEDIASVTESVLSILEGIQDTTNLIQRDTKNLKEIAEEQTNHVLKTDEISDNLHDSAKKLREMVEDYHL